MIQMGDVYVDNVALHRRSPFERAGLPVHRTFIILSEIEAIKITSIAPFANQTDNVSAQLTDAIGIALPEDGWSVRTEDAELIWSQMGQWFLFGPEVALVGAALTDQTDGWSGLSLRGDGVMDVMARLCPVDLRPLQPGQVVRTECAHRMSVLVRREDGIDMFVMRSLARNMLDHVMVAIDRIPDS